MIKNYLIVAFRNIFRNRVSSIINIVGLSVGLASSILIMMFIWHEMTYDNFHPNVENTYRVYSYQPTNVFLNSNSFNVVPAPFQPEVKSRYPEVKFATRLKSMNKLLMVDENHLGQERFYCVDQDFCNMFDLQMIFGQKEGALIDQSSVLLAESIAKKYFGDENPVGKIIKLEEYANLVVKGVYKDFPSNSHFDLKILVPFSITEYYVRPQTLADWTSSSFPTYLQLDNTISKADFESKLIDLIKDKKDEETEDRFLLQKVQDIHLYGKLNFEISSNGDIKYVLIFGAIAFFLLLIAAFNYMNLATARSFKRAKEVGIRKVVGANQGQLFKQFIGEALLVSFISLLFALILIEIFEPYFNEFVDRNITFYGLDPVFYIVIFLIVLLIAVFSGSYPALYLARFSPVKVLKGGEKRSSKSVIFRNIVVVLQFVISVTLIICTLVVNQQLRFIKNKKLGFQTENIISLNLNTPELIAKKEVLKNEFLKYPGIMDVTTSDNMPSRIRSRSTYKYDGINKEETARLYFIRVNYNFIDFYNMKLLEGVDFSNDMLSENDVIINEAAAKSMGYEHVIGKTLRKGRGENESVFTIIGIVENFHFTPLNQEIQPAVLIYQPLKNRTMSVKINPLLLDETLAFMERKVSEISSKYPFVYESIKESIDRSYREERRLSSLFNFFTVIAIIIACLGLFGLISFTTEQRRKEIGIRKVQGASIRNILFLLSGNISRWVIIANIIAWPIAWYFMSLWLANFVYRIELSFGVFLLAGLLSFLIAFITATYQSLRAALANPVDALKYE